MTADSVEEQEGEAMWPGPVRSVVSLSRGACSSSYQFVQQHVSNLINIVGPFAIPLLGERPTPSQVADKALKDHQKLVASGKAGTPGSRLRHALKDAAEFDWRARVLGAVELGGIMGAAGGMLQPQGPGTCDCNACERCCNVITSAPYIVAGVHAMKHRKTREGRLWGASVAAVGVASATFHSSTGRWRDLGRKLDYWTIALSSNLLVRAVYPQMPLAATLAGALITPFRPFLVSTINSVLMETKFLMRAHESGVPSGVRNAQLIHSACCVLGLAAFTLEDLQPQIPLTHATWHCLSAGAVTTTNALLESVEQQEHLRRTSSQALSRGSSSQSQPRVGELLHKIGRDLSEMRSGHGSLDRVVSDIESLGGLRVRYDDDDDKPTGRGSSNLSAGSFGGGSNGGGGGSGGSFSSRGSANK